MKKIYLRNDKQGLKFLFNIMTYFKGEYINESVMDVLVQVNGDYQFFEVD